MIIVISIDRDFSNYDFLKKCISSIKQNYDVKEFRAITNNLLQQFNKKNSNLITLYNIDWNDLSCGTVKQNNYGKQYNADAPQIAAQTVIDGASHFATIGKGDYFINKLAKEDLEEVIIDIENLDSKKIYKF